MLVRSLVQDFSIPVAGDVNLSLHWNNEHVTVPGVSAPVGSPEAIDAITTASRPISGDAYQDYEKVRNELEGQATRGPVSVGYYYSTESDYVGQQVSATYNRDLRDDQLNLSFGTSYGWDDILPLENQRSNTAASTKNTMHWNAVATQLLSPTSVVRVSASSTTTSPAAAQPVPSRGRHDVGPSAILHARAARRVREVPPVPVEPVESPVRLPIYDDDWGVLSRGRRRPVAVRHAGCTRYQYRWY